MDTILYSSARGTVVVWNHLFSSVYNVYFTILPVMTRREGHTVKSAVANEDGDNACSPPLILNNANHVLDRPRKETSSLLMLFTSVRCTQW